MHQASERARAGKKNEACTWTLTLVPVLYKGYGALTSTLRKQGKVFPRRKRATYWKLLTLSLTF